MAFYDLLIVNEQKHLATVARDQSEALSNFGKELGLHLSLDDSDSAFAVYFLDEWQIGPHFVNPTIPVYATAIHQ